MWLRPYRVRSWKDDFRVDRSPGRVARTKNPKTTLASKSFLACTVGRGKDSTRRPEFRNFPGPPGLFYK